MKGYLHSLPKSVNCREEYDRYWTPRYVVDALLEREKFEGTILEPACGLGHISNTLANAGYNVESTDIVYGDDFYDCENKVPNIITNPPYGETNRFIEKCLDIATTKVALMCRFHVLVSKGRYSILKHVPNIKVYIFTTPIMMPTPGGGWKKGSAFTHCWLVLNLNSSNKQREFDWIQFDKHSPLDFSSDILNRV